jgi:hypothetical protein
MSVVVEISNPANLKKAQNLLGAKTESETLELALERVIEDFESKQLTLPDEDLSDDFFEDLFAEQTNLSDGESVQAILKEREGRGSDKKIA